MSQKCSFDELRASDTPIGRFLDRNYRLTAEKLPNVQRDAPDFPIERTRLRGIFALITISALGTLGYGLALMTKTVSVLAILQSYLN